MSAYVWENNSSNIANNNQNNDDNYNGICRIYVDPDIEKRIVVDELSLPESNYQSTNSDGQYDIKNLAGFEYPLICINNNFLKDEEINQLEISSIDLIPTISLIISPKDNNLIIKEFVKDGDIISVFIRTTSDVITPLRCDFLIKSCKIIGYEVNEQGSEPTIILKGELNIPGIYSSKDNLFNIGSSKNAIKEIAKKIGTGFAFNDVEDSNDCQLWFSSKQKMTEYIKNITSHIWKDEQSFFKVWFDFYYNLNYINVNKCLMSEDDIDLTIETLVNTMQDVAPTPPDEENAQMGSKILTNFENNKRSPFYILDFKVKNNSSNITNEVGANIVNQMFIHNQNYYNQGENPYIELSNVQMYDPQKRDDSVILRGRNSFDRNSAQNGDMSYNTENPDDSNTVTQWRGIQYTISDADVSNGSNSWSGNVNVNYNRAETHNLINNKELDKMYINVTVNGPCLQIMRGEKIPIIIVYKDTLDFVSNNNEKAKGVNKLYSGYYFVDGIKIVYSYEDKEGLENNFYTTFTLKRREWPVPVDYEKDNSE